jgi:predicted phosphodiesterase
MKLKIVSDLHLEFEDLVIPNDEGCDVLVLSGDILVAEDLYDYPSPDPYTPGAMANFGRRMQSAQRFRNFLKRVSETFPHVIYVAGNHELYHGKWVKGINFLRDYCRTNFSNVHFLERDIVTVDDITFVGGTLWTDMNRGDPLTLHAVRDMMNDFRIILNDEKGFTRLKPMDTAIRHRETLGYIKTIVAGMHNEKFVVVGHHAPSRLSIHEKYKNDYLMNGAYSSDLSEFILDHPQIKLWTHGHTHHCFDYMIGSTRVVCNPRGYAGHEETGFDLTKVVEV